MERGGRGRTEKGEEGEKRAYWYKLVVWHEQMWSHFFQAFSSNKHLQSSLCHFSLLLLLFLLTGAPTHVSCTNRVNHRYMCNHR